ncbi:hypothetical protein MN116_001302 [Schistosoma mekongi]|uniref:Transposase IS30-like HTH domain-containing protein n=1 Tax=Schistosoma mekongi TaxID=38744 RepID=A0AAE1ZMF2_SCHME|nr:hypothetical protein MN116_001302 [Schistosoma mekongi]
MDSKKYRKWGKLHMGRYLTESERRNVLKLYEEGRNVEEIARYFGRGEATVRRIINGTWRPKRYQGDVSKRILEDKYFVLKVKANRLKNLKKLQSATLSSLCRGSLETRSPASSSIKSSNKSTDSSNTCPPKLRDISEYVDRVHPKELLLSSHGSPVSVHDFIKFLCSKETSSNCNSW